MSKIFTLENFLGDSSHKSTIFSPAQVNFVEQAAYTKIIRGKSVPFIKCLVRGKEIRLTPEEAVRQMFIRKLIDEYGYKIAQMAVEHPIHFGREVKRADIVIFEQNHPTSAYIIVEVKKPKLKDGKEQLKSYCNATGATMGVWSNGEKISFYHRKDPNYFEDIPDIPNSTQKLKEILRFRRTIADLIAEDKLLRENKTLADLIRELEDEVLANAGVDVFEEVFKLIYTKLFDEMLGNRDENRILEFWNYGETDSDLKDTIQILFDRAKDKWPGVFAADDRIKLSPSHLAICVSSLQNVKLFNSNLDIIDDAFEYLMSKSQKGEKGQFFTPRYVIDMCVRMLNPKVSEKMIDTAAGSCGFPVHTIFYVKNQISPLEFDDYVTKNVFAIDFDEKTVRVGRTLNLIAGDGKTNVLHLNTLDYERWNETIDDDWREIYFNGWAKLCKIRAEKDNSRFNFDIVMANPPFAGDIKESRVIAKYELGKNPKGKILSKVGRDILFIERNLNFLKPGGRMAIVLPQGRFNNSSDKNIRDFIAERCRILAVVGLHGNVFKPHTGTKTSVLFVQKWDENLCPRRDDYPIFFATMREPSKNNSGDKIFEKIGSKLLLDSHDHPIVKHDLFNHENLTHDGIAEAFIEFAKRERLSFFEKSSFDAQKYKILSEELEVTEIFLSEIDLGDRFDAEYFTKNYLHISKVLAQVHTKKLGKLVTTVASAFYPAATDLYSIGDLPFARCVDCISYPIITREQNERFERIPSWFAHENNGVSTIRREEIVLTKVGTPCYASLLTDYDEIALSRTVMGLTAIRDVNPYYLMIFLRCKYGFEQLHRQRELTIQYQLTVPRVNAVNIFIPSEDFQLRIKNLCLAYLDAITNADETYHLAEKTLSEALNLENFKPSCENVAIKSFSASFGVSGRLDAEFYQPKYDYLKNFLATLETYKLGDLVKIFKSIEPGSDSYGTEGTPFIRVSNVNKFGISEPEIKIAEKFSDEYFPRKNTILFSKDGSIGIAYHVREDLTAITSGALLHLTIKNKSQVLPDYLTLVLNSELVQMQAERDANGAIIKHWKPEDVKKVLVPVVSRDVQEKIALQVAESFRLRGESEKLLTRAKSAVELAIEHDENFAINFLGD